MSLDNTLAQIDKQYGKGSVFVIGERKSIPVEVVSSGSLAIDIATGVGGFPKGRIIEIFGVESGGKTTIALQAIAEVQKLKGKAAFIDAEHSLDVHYAEALGVDVDNLLVSQPDSGEQALEIAKALVESGEINIVVIDSVAALVPQAELDGSMGDAQMGLQARLMSQAMRKLNGAINANNVIFIFINQIRSKIGVMFGSPETTTGGGALKFYATMRIDVRRTEIIKSGETKIGARTRAKIVKNKVSAPFREAEFDLIYGKGVSKVGELVDIGTAYGLITRSGAWYSYDGKRIGQGRDNVIRFLTDEPKIAYDIESNIRIMATKPAVVVEK